ncbi:hypothetical protein HanXRQr2_Chr03g0133681 [Helianthus annuus]|uniref:Uncharacterized protein n=1 Tax=Helianthus annuus TaxID=4232 RepID=A0A251VCV6_HELAN|nr:hypothetical protein HanXRQr2_Chr03g0133681 [Helianthus annuus]KAJ0945641.1 hypothetical protein HanPSC8_Chr03g0130421 [Helianthus annuus]
MDEVLESEDFDYVINEGGIMTEVLDPKDQGCNLVIALADIVSMVMRISKKDLHALVSAQPLVDSNSTTPTKMRCFSVDFGLESEETYSLTPVKRDRD